MAKVKFIETVNGINYNCYREIEGKIKRTQTIYVENLGFEVDPEEYGNKIPYQDINLMSHFASRIARSIINKSKNPT